jgi:TIR domain-containing protein
MTHDIFIAHLPQDRDLADAACAALERRGLGCWIAPRDLPRDLGHEAAVAAAIAGSRLFLLIFSADTNASALALREAEKASASGLPILALRIADIAPAPALGFLVGEWFDALVPPVASHLDALGDRAMQLLGAGPGPLLPTLPPRPFPPRRRNHWLPIALAGAAGVAAIALAAAYGARP